MGGPQGAKLSLARVYLDMGDKKATLKLLDEVVAEGSDEQKREAADLLARVTK
jgi:pilus assembly protein FimV